MYSCVVDGPFTRPTSLVYTQRGWHSLILCVSLFGTTARPLICCHTRIRAGNDSVALPAMTAAKLSLSAASCIERNDARLSSAEATL
jgi:hypothetical protein